MTGGTATSGAARPGRGIAGVEIGGVEIEPTPGREGVSTDGTLTEGTGRAGTDTGGVVTARTLTGGSWVTPALARAGSDESEGVVSGEAVSGDRVGEPSGPSAEARTNGLATLGFVPDEDTPARVARVELPSLSAASAEADGVLVCAAAAGAGR